MRQRFAQEDIKNAPEEPGIYCLFQDRDLVYIGRTAPRTTLREELVRALQMGDEIQATHFTYELSKSPKTRANEELRSFYETWGRLPLYNRPHAVDLRQRAELRR